MHGVESNADHRQNAEGDIVSRTSELSGGFEPTITISTFEYTFPFLCRALALRLTGQDMRLSLPTEVSQLRPRDFQGHETLILDGCLLKVYGQPRWSCILISRQARMQHR